jgi:hypothetical protein
VGMVAIQLRCLFELFGKFDILNNSNDTKQEIYKTILLFLTIVLNRTFLTIMLIEKGQYLKNIFLLNVVIVGLNLRIYGYKDFSENLAKKCLNTFGLMVALPLFMFCSIKLLSINTK